MNTKLFIHLKLNLPQTGVGVERGCCGSVGLWPGQTLAYLIMILHVHSQARTLCYTFVKTPSDIAVLPFFYFPFYFFSVFSCIFIFYICLECRSNTFQPLFFFSLCKQAKISVAVRQHAQLVDICFSYWCIMDTQAVEVVDTLELRKPNWKIWMGELPRKCIIYLQ